MYNEKSIIQSVSAELNDSKSSMKPDYYTNNIHSYPAKMLANIPSVIIPKFSKR